MSEKLNEGARYCCAVTILTRLEVHPVKKTQDKEDTYFPNEVAARALWGTNRVESLLERIHRAHDHL